ncbi:MAG: enoyl-ACP reductase, partial [Pseudomonadota bacterium]|nr:enoyl-ACP reductase [Pseudomonadota bacterium]
QMRQPEKRRLSANPYSLNPMDKLSGPDQGDQLYSKWDGIANMWTAPFIMAGINTRIVRRTNALLDNSYGANFCYSEVMGYRAGFRGWFRAKMMTVGFLCMGALMFFRLSRKILLRLFLPSPGQGPSEEKMKNGRFKAMFCAIHGTDKSWWEVSFDGDPGYSQTAIMLAESALALGLDRSNLSGQYGVITPSVGLGDVLLSRLRARGMIFRTVAR